MIEQHEYPVTLRWTDTKRGVADSRDDLPALVVTTPPEFGGPSHQWSPEHLFVASVASCFMTTFLAIAENSKLEIEKLDIPAIGSLVRGEDRRYSIERVRLQPELTIRHEKDRAKAERLIAKSDEICLISRSIRSEIVMEPTIHVTAE